LHIYSEIIIILATNQILFLFRDKKYHFHLFKWARSLSIIAKFLSYLFLQILWDALSDKYFSFKQHRLQHHFSIVAINKLHPFKIRICTQKNKEKHLWKKKRFFIGVQKVKPFTLICASFYPFCLLTHEINTSLMIQSIQGIINFFFFFFFLTIRKWSLQF